MHALTFGEGKNVIFLHGWGGDVSAFLIFARRLCAEYRVTAAEFDGFGTTPEPARPYGVDDYAAATVALMDERKIDRAVVVGHSFGGRVAMELAAKYPDRVAALALVDSAGIKPRRKPSYYVKVFLHKFLKKLGFKGLSGSSDYSVLSPVMKATFVNVVNYDQTPVLKDIKCPVALFWGRNDTETPPYMAETIKNGVSDAHIFWLEGGHFAYLDDAEKFYVILKSFIAQTAR